MTKVDSLRSLHIYNLHLELISVIFIESQPPTGLLTIFPFIYLITIIFIIQTRQVYCHKIVSYTFIWFYRILNGHFLRQKQKKILKRTCSVMRFSSSPITPPSQI